MATHIQLAATPPLIGPQSKVPKHLSSHHPGPAPPYPDFWQGYDHKMLDGSTPQGVSKVQQDSRCTGSM